MLVRIRGIKVEAVKLHPTNPNQQAYRERLFDKLEMLRVIHKLQNNPQLKILGQIDPEKVSQDLFALLYKSNTDYFGNNEEGPDDFLAHAKEAMPTSLKNKDVKAVKYLFYEYVKLLFEHMNAGVTSGNFDTFLKINIDSVFDDAVMDEIFNGTITEPDLKRVLKSFLVQMYYSIEAEDDAYKSGDIPEENIALMLDSKDEGNFRLRGVKEEDEILMKLVCKKVGEKIVRKRIVEVAPGNGELSRTFKDLSDRFGPLTQFGHVPFKGQIRGAIFDAAMQNAFGVASTSKKRTDPFVHSVDIIPKFVEKGRKKLIDARRGDICRPVDKIYAETLLPANDADIVVGNLFFDRVDVLNAALRFLKSQAKLNGSTKFLFGFYAPFSPKTTSFSKNENIPELDCFDPFDEQTEDIRKNWVSSDPEKPFSRAETIYRIIYSLIANGFKTTHAADHEYEVYSVHCISEPARVLRTDPKYAFLKTYDFKDNELNARRDAVFEGKFHDDELVGFPERENIILIAGKITLPEDWRAYEMIDFDKAAKERHIEVDPSHPKFDFLRNYTFPKRRFGKLRDKIFRESKPSPLPFRAHMKGEMMRANKEYLAKLKDKDREPGSDK